MAGKGAPQASGASRVGFPGIAYVLVCWFKHLSINLKGVSTKFCFDWRGGGGAGEFRHQKPPTPIF